MQRCACLVDLVTGGAAIGPDVAELIEMIQTAAGDENEIVDINSGLQESSRFLRMIADESRLRIENRVGVSRVTERVGEQTTYPQLFVRRPTEVRNSGSVTVIVVWTRIVRIEPTCTD